MDIQITAQAAREIACDVLLVGVSRKASEAGIALSSQAQSIDELLNGIITERSTAGEFKGSAGELLTIHPMGKLAAQRVIVFGLGKQGTITTQSLQRASATAIRHAQKTGAQQIALTLWNDGIMESALTTQALVEGVLLGQYTFKKYQSSSNDRVITQLRILTEGDDTAEITHAIHKAQILAEATNFARDLINEPPNVLTPGELANRAVAMAKQAGLEWEVFEKEKIEELQMGGLLGVTQGSQEPPKFIVLRYRGAPQSTDKGMALVGKGITFDSGGISIKPAAGMDEMKGDMGGAAAVLGAMQAIAGLQPALNVTALVPTCENMPSGTAFRPGDILRIMNGKTIEIVNTDAEGRLILADALSYASKEGLSPIIDLATLTGGIVVALGYTMTGLFCNDELLTDEILAAGRAAGEKYWPMPLDEEYAEQIRSDIADIKQTGGRTASSVTAAKILENFVQDAQWAHLDIAGTSYGDKKAYQEKGGTGVGVRTLTELALRLAQ
ncbi:MAG: leucyl aminopeptidase [Ktedonobacteraceae bacterium]|nr:leucyl aminopeptidase [Ktedonobacteraceae bacterium]